MGSHDEDRESLKLLLEKGLQYYDQGDMKRCLGCCDAVLHSDTSQHDSSQHKAFNLAGLAYLNLGEVNVALRYINKAFELSKEEEYLLNIAEILRRCSMVQQAYDVLMSVQNKSLKHYDFNLAKVCVDLGKSDEAKACYEQALCKNPKDSEILFNLANLWAKEDSRIAARYYEQSYQLGCVSAGINLASLWSKEDKNTQALKLYGELEQSNPSADVYYNYANLLAKMSFDDIAYFEKAKQYYQKALQMEAKVIYALNYSQLLLRFGEVQEGFKQAQKRLELDIIPEILKPYVQRFNFKTSRSVLLYHEQGYGDSLIFLRFVPLLAQKCERIFLCIQKPLQPLLQAGYLGLRDYENIFFLEELPNEVMIKQSGFDSALSLLSLPFVLGLKEADELRECLKIPSIPKPQSHKIKLGIAFKSNPQAMAFEEKSIPLETLLESLCECGCELYCLQRDCDEQEKALLERYGVQNLGEGINDFGDTLKRLQDLDGVVSIDSAVAHLSASLGLKTFVLLHKYYDWRFASPNHAHLLYHDQVHCYRQQTLHDWKIPLQALQESLKACREKGK